MHKTLRLCLGITICVSVAVLLSMFLNDSGQARLAAPVLCLLVLIPTSSFFGRLSGFIGSVTASLVLALLLFPPVGSLSVHKPATRTMLILSQLAALVAVISSPQYYISGATFKSQSRRTLSSAYLVNSSDRGTPRSSCDSRFKTDMK